MSFNAPHTDCSIITSVLMYLLVLQVVDVNLKFEFINAFY
jgi:hypothetical protein